MKEKIKVIVNDLDGTWVDSLTPTALAVKAACEELGLPVPENIIGECRSGGTMPQILGRLFPDSPESSEIAYSGYRKLFDEKFVHEINMFPGADEALSKLKENRFGLGIVTNGTRHGTEAVVARLGWHELFPVRISRDHVSKEEAKPHRRPMELALSMLKADASEAIYVGDTRTDVLFAHNAEMKCILVLWDRDERSPEFEGADYVIKKIGELPEMMERINGGL